MLRTLTSDFATDAGRLHWHDKCIALAREREVGLQNLEMRLQEAHFAAFGCFEEGIEKK